MPSSPHVELLIEEEAAGPSSATDPLEPSRAMDASRRSRRRSYPTECGVLGPLILYALLVFGIVVTAATIGLLISMNGDSQTSQHVEVRQGLRQPPSLPLYEMSDFCEDTWKKLASYNATRDLPTRFSDDYFTLAREATKLLGTRCNYSADPCKQELYVRRFDAFRGVYNFEGGCNATHVPNPKLYLSRYLDVPVF